MFTSRGGRSHVAAPGTIAKAKLKLLYEEQIAAKRQREARRKQQELQEDIARLQNADILSPWGRGGAGAPLRDANGVIANLGKVFAHSRVPHYEPLSPSPG